MVHFCLWFFFIYAGKVLYTLQTVLAGPILTRPGDVPVNQSGQTAMDVDGAGSSSVTEHVMTGAYDIDILQSASCNVIYLHMQVPWLVLVGTHEHC